MLVEDGWVRRGRAAPLLLPALVLVVGGLRRQVHQGLPRRHQLHFPRKSYVSLYTVINDAPVEVVSR